MKLRTLLGVGCVAAALVLVCAAPANASTLRVIHASGFGLKGAAQRGSCCGSREVLAGYANAYVQAGAVPGSAAPGFRISNAASGDYTAFAQAANGSYLPVLDNLPYIFSVSVEGGTSAQQEISVQIEWRSAQGQVLGTSLGYPSNLDSIVSSGVGTSPQQVVVYGESPPDAAIALPKIAITESPPAGSAIFAVAPSFRLATAGLKLPRPGSSNPGMSSYRYDPFGVYFNQRRPTAYSSRQASCTPTYNHPCYGYDAHGIPIVNYGGTIGVQYDPYTIAGNGLDMYSSFLYTHHHDQVREAVRDASWLVEHQEADGRWLYFFPDANYLLQPPWPSAVAQGGAISLLVRIWRRSGDPRYLKAAKLALLPYSRPEATGGVLALWGKHWFYQEAPNPAFPSFILNGFMGALLGLYDLSVAAPRSNAKTLYERGWKSLVAMLPLYDDGVGESIYDLGYLTLGSPKRPAASGYQRQHILYLRAINSVSPSPVLRYFMDRWRR